MAEKIERRLAAILSADVVAYGRLMGADEEGTLARLRTHRSELIDPQFAAHNGRIVKLMGDGVLVEFASVVDAVRCAAEIQRGMVTRNASEAEDQRIILRIGINLGDIIVEGDDIHGDGVNIAARMEQLAAPGGITISGTAFDHARNKVDVGFEDLGPQAVKNIAEPVRTYRVLLEPEMAGQVVARKAAAKRTPKRRRWTLAGAAIVTIIAIAAIVIVLLEPWVPHVDPADPAKMAYALPEKPSIAVLPFDNLTGDPEQDYLGDGLSENIIAVLSSSPDLFVIARNSAFTFKGRPVRVQEVAELLGVRYVLEGSVQRDGDQLRVTAQLVDAIDGRHLWAERYDHEFGLKSLFAIQDEITQQILVSMHVNLTIGEDARRTWEAFGDLETYQRIIRARAHLYKNNPKDHRAAEKLIAEVYAGHPEIAAASLWMSWIHWQKISLALSEDPAATMAKAREFAENALEIGAYLDAAHVVLASLDVCS
jgi:TolB-like protein/class 3 adenylate cyclase